MFQVSRCGWWQEDNCCFTQSFQDTGREWLCHLQYLALKAIQISLLISGHRKERNVHESGHFYGPGLHMAHITFTHIHWLTRNCNEGCAWGAPHLGRKEDQILGDSWNSFQSKSKWHSHLYVTDEDIFQAHNTDTELGTLQMSSKLLIL